MVSRTRMLYGLGMLLLMLLTPLAQARADWTMFQGDPSHTGVAYVEPVTNPQVLWHTALSTVVYSSPVVSQGVMYLGANDNSVHAIDATTGREIWRFNATGPVISTPAVGSNHIFFGSDDGKVYAIDKTVGTLIWSYTTGGKVESSPTINLQSQILYIGSDDGYLYALNADSGALVWRFNSGSAIRQSPALSNGVVYVGCFSYMYAINAITGVQIWRYSLLTVHTSYTTSTCAVANGIVYFGASLNQNPLVGKFIALKSTNGVLLWSNTIDVSAPFSCPAISNGIAYVSSIDDNLYALNATTGSQLWHKTTGGAITSSPVVALNVVYVGSTDHKLYALDRITGAGLWDFTASSSIDTGIAVDNARVYFFASDPQFFAVVYVLKDGTLVVDVSLPSNNLYLSTQVLIDLLPIVGLVVGLTLIKNPDEWRAILGLLVLAVVLMVFATIFSSWGF